MSVQETIPKTILLSQCVCAASPWYKPFHRSFRAACYLVSHALVAIIIIALITLIQRVLIADGNPLLFDVCPLRYIFDAVDVTILGVFMWFGTLEAIETFKGHEHAH
jgi:hypothetical protein